MSDYLFSVIIPVYNCSGTIIRALDSISIQEYNNCEVILIDDCSPDNSAELINEYIKTHHSYRITLISNNVNCGPAESRNKGILAAKGEYVCFLDSDDYLSDSYFKTLNGFVKTDHPDIIYIGYNHVFGNVVRKISNSTFPNKDSFIAGASASLWRFVVKTEIIKTLKLPDLRNAEDIAVIPLLIGSSNKISFCNSTLYNYIHSNSSLSGQHSPSVSINFIKSFEYTLAHIKAPYSPGIEFHGIKTVLYGAILNALKAKIAASEIYDIIEHFEMSFKDWHNNMYINNLPRQKRLYLRCIKHRNVRLLKLYAYCQNLILKFM